MVQSAVEQVQTIAGEALLDRARREKTPLIDGERVTFVWQGTKAPQLIGDFNNWGWGPGKPLDLLQIAPDIWAQSVTLPLDAYIEYGFVQAGQRVRDPLNPRANPTGLGGFNQFFRMPGSLPTPLVRVRRGVPRGTLTRHIVQGEHLIASGHRTVHLYQPPTADPAPLLVVYDGQDYLRRARLPQMMDNLIAQQRIRPLALALVEHGGSARFVEYMCNESTVAFLLRSVLPLAQAELKLLDIQTNPGAYGVLGASMGGLMALYTGFRAPEVFGRVLSQSGSFAFEVLGREALIVDLIQQREARPLNIWLDVGQFEFLLPSNRRVRDLLQSKGYDLVYREYPGEHNYTSWRDDLWRGLEALFPPEGAGEGPKPRFGALP